MEIGGHDHILESKPTPSKARFLLKLISLTWPEAEIAGVDSEEDTEPLRHFDRDVKIPSEWLVYRDPESEASWRDDGATEENEGWHLHLLFGEGSYTIVSGVNPECESYKLAIDLMSSIKAHE